MTDWSRAALSYPAPPRASEHDQELEDLGDPAVTAWAAAQSALAGAVLDAVPARAAIRSRLAELWHDARPGVPFERGGRWFWTRRSGRENQPALYVADDPGATGQVLLDPDALAADGMTAVAAMSVSPDGALVAYATSASGSDWLTWHVRDAVSGADLGDTLRWSQDRHAEWRRDSSGFYYAAARRPPPGELRAPGPSEIFFHRAGTARPADELVFAAGDPAWYPAFAISTDGCYLIVTLSRGIGPGAEVRVLDLRRPVDGFRVLIPYSDTLADVVATEHDTFYVLTDDAADRRRIVAVDAARPGRAHWREIVPAGADTLLEAHFFGGRLVCHYLRDACSRLRVFRTDGTGAGDIPLPALATVSGSPVEHEQITGDPASGIVHVEAESFTQSPALWSHDLDRGTTTLRRAPAIALDPARFVTERVSVTSADGTVLPMFLTRRHDLRPDGNAPVLLHGYGGVGVPVTPSFQVPWAVWVERGGLLAVASLRGGSEYGRAWHDAGRRASKQNVFDDFCACARWLAAAGWSRAARIGIHGGSNGGLLVGACLTQHPELFGAAVADAGLFDMLRYHRFASAWLWKTEYGDPEDPEQCQWLRAYSPLHHVRPGRYPATLLATGDHDDRVVPSHSYKFAAALQAAQQASAPILLRLTADAGHGGRTPAASAIAAAADRLAFLEAALGVNDGEFRAVT